VLAECSRRRPPIFADSSHIHSHLASHSRSSMTHRRCFESARILSRSPCISDRPTISARNHRFCDARYDLARTSLWALRSSRSLTPAYRHRVWRLACTLVFAASRRCQQFRKRWGRRPGRARLVFLHYIDDYLTTKTWQQTQASPGAEIKGTKIVQSQSTIYILELSSLSRT